MHANYLTELRSLLAIHHLWVAEKGESPDAFGERRMAICVRAQLININR